MRLSKIFVVLPLDEGAFFPRGFLREHRLFLYASADGATRSGNTEQCTLGPFAPRGVDYSFPSHHRSRHGKACGDILRICGVVEEATRVADTLRCVGCRSSRKNCTRIV